MLNLTATGAVILTSKLLTYQRTAEETAAKLNRPNFLHRVYCVGSVLASADSYQEAAEALVDGGWFTELGPIALAAAMEAEADDLMTYAAGLGLPIDGLVTIKVEPAMNPIQPQASDDIPI